MKFRDVEIYNGESFTVPQCIQRIDSYSTHGWQVRYGGTKMYSDGQYGGSRKALELATKDLLNRIATLPAPIGLKQVPLPSKRNSLPPGVSGPIRTHKSGKVPSAHFSVLIPQHGKPAKLRTVYIGTMYTYTIKREKAALEKAIGLRQAAEAKYIEDATRARRKDALALKRALKSGALTL